MQSSTEAPSPVAAATAASGTADAGPLLVPPEIMTTNAVNRNLSDLHTPTWLALLAVNITGRTLAFHPLQLAISRKRVTRSERPPTAGALMKAAYRGGKQSFPARGGGGCVDTFDLGRGGVRGCYRGVGAALVSNLVGEMSYLFTLEVLKERLGNGAGKGGSREGAEDEEERTALLVTDRDSADTPLAPGDAPLTAPPLTADDFAANSASAAAGAMVGDLVSLVLVTPTVILCNRQMTAGYGMAAGNTYRSMAATYREVWSLYQDPTTTARRTTARLMSAEKAFSIAWWQNGFRGIYQGTSAGLLRIPSSGCWWALYTKSKEAVYRVASPALVRLEERRLRELADNPTGKSLSLWTRNWFLSPTDNPLLNAVAGIFASVCTTILFNPMAVIQTRQQSLPPGFWSQQRARQVQKLTAEELAARSASLSYKVKKVLPFQKVYAVAADLVRTEGPMAFFKGSFANVGVAVMDGVIFSLLFEMSKLGSDTQFLEQMGAAEKVKKEH